MTSFLARRQTTLYGTVVALQGLVPRAWFPKEALRLTHSQQPLSVGNLFQLATRNLFQHAVSKSAEATVVLGYPGRPSYWEAKPETMGLPASRLANYLATARGCKVSLCKDQMARAKAKAKAKANIGK